MGLTDETNHYRRELNQEVFLIAVEKNYKDVVAYLIETGDVKVTWDVLRTLVQQQNEDLVKLCIKYKTPFDSAMSGGRKKVQFAGRTAGVDDRYVRIIDFMQVMLDFGWKTIKIKEVLSSYAKKAKFDDDDLREIFLMFTVNRKIKLMSFLINNRE